MSEVAFFAIFTTFFPTCSSDTREDAKTYTTDFLQLLYRHRISLLLSEFSSLSPFSPSVCLAFERDAGEVDRPFRL